MSLNELTRKHGVKIPPLYGCSVEDCSLAVGDLVGHSSVKSAARMNNAVVIFLDSVEAAEVVAKNGIEVGDFFLPAYSLCSPAVKVNVTNVPPFISNEAITRELSKHGKVVSPVRRASSGFKSPLLKHVVSHKRHLLMIPNNRTREVNLVFKITVEDFDYVVFAKTDDFRCFSCGKEGHMSRACPEKKGSHKDQNQNREFTEEGRGDKQDRQEGTGGVQKGREEGTSEAQEEASENQEVREEETSGTQEEASENQEVREEETSETQEEASENQEVREEETSETQEETSEIQEVREGTGRQVEPRVRPIPAPRVLVPESGLEEDSESSSGEEDDGADAAEIMESTRIKSTPADTPVPQPSSDPAAAASEQQRPPGSEVDMEGDEEQLKTPQLKRKKREDSESSRAKKVATGGSGEAAESEAGLEEDSESSSEEDDAADGESSERKDYSVEEIQDYLKKSKNVRGAKVEDYLSDKEKFCNSVRSHMRSKDRGGLTEQEGFRLVKIVRKVRKELKNDGAK